MLGGIDNNSFLEGFFGFLVVGLLMIPLLKWIFPTPPSVKAEKAKRREIKRDLRRLKAK